MIGVSHLRYQRYSANISTRARAGCSPQRVGKARWWYSGGAVGSSLRKRSSVPLRTVSGRTFARLGSALVNVADVFEDVADSGPPIALGSV